MLLYLVAFLAWMLTILAPCVLPVLPIILSGSLSKKQWRKSRVIIGSCIVSIVLFTILVKLSTQFIGFDIWVLTTISWCLILWYGLTLLFPDMRDLFIIRIGLRQKSSISFQSEWFLKDILLGLSLWPIFTTCSPTYALILGVVFPISFFQWFVATILYAIGFGLMLVLVAWWWRSITLYLRWYSDPQHRFKKFLWIILIIIGILIITGYIKHIEARLINYGRYGALQFEQVLVDYIK